MARGIGRYRIGGKEQSQHVTPEQQRLIGDAMTEEILSGKRQLKMVVKDKGDTTKITVECPKRKDEK
jgi:hypothetical protein